MGASALPEDVAQPVASAGSQSAVTIAKVATADATASPSCSTSPSHTTRCWPCLPTLLHTILWNLPLFPVHDDRGHAAGHPSSDLSAAG